MRDYVTCDVFTTHRFGGNPLAVVLQAEDLSDEQMLSITREFNYSETTFVLPPQNPKHSCRLRIFTPGGELPFAGHPTVGTAFVLANTGTFSSDVQTLVLEETVGPVSVRINRQADGQVSECVFTSPRNPVSRVQLLAPAQAATLLSLPLRAIGTLPIAPWSCGLAFLIIPLASQQALSDCLFDTNVWKTTLKDRWAQKVYPIFIDAAKRKVHTRMFMMMGSNPIEDPATGSAAAALAGYLAAHIETRPGYYDWNIVQGEKMGRTSCISLRFKWIEGQAQEVQIGGTCIAVMRGQLAV